MICHNITLTLGNILICTFPCIKGETEASESSRLAQGCPGSLQSRGGPEHWVLSQHPPAPLCLPTSVLVGFSLAAVSSEPCKLHRNVISGVPSAGRSLRDAPSRLSRPVCRTALADGKQRSWGATSHWWSPVQPPTFCPGSARPTRRDRPLHHCSRDGSWAFQSYMSPLLGRKQQISQGLM